MYKETTMCRLLFMQQFSCFRDPASVSRRRDPIPENWKINSTPTHILRS